LISFFYLILKIGIRGDFLNLKELKVKMPEIFETVKKDVRKVLGRHRAGLRLGLAELGMSGGGFIGGMHYHPGTDIIMNKSPLKIILEDDTDEITLAYTYHILLHEYIHSLRFFHDVDTYGKKVEINLLNEKNCRLATKKVSKEIFKRADHPAIILAEKGIGYFISNLKIAYIPPEMRPDGIPIEYIYEFDRESQTYFS
jgi:hypothetical protein